MAEAAALALGVAGLFNSAIECFNLTRVGQNFDRDNETYQVQLLLLQNRLSQWGSAIGLDSDGDDSKLEFPTAEKRTAAERALAQIIRLFNDIEKKPVSDNRRATDSDFSNRMKQMCRKMRELSMGRKTKDAKTSFITKAKWALTESHEVDKLVSAISELINELIATFPAPKNEQNTKEAEQIRQKYDEFRRRYEEVCLKDAEALAQTDRDPLKLLDDAWGKHDAMLKDALSKIAGAAAHKNQTTIHGDNNKGLIQGVNYGTQNTSW